MFFCNRTIDDAGARERRKKIEPSAVRVDLSYIKAKCFLSSRKKKRTSEKERKIYCKLGEKKSDENNQITCRSKNIFFFHRRLRQQQPGQRKKRRRRGSLVVVLGTGSIKASSTPTERNNQQCAPFDFFFLYSIECQLIYEKILVPCDTSFCFSAKITSIFNGSKPFEYNVSIFFPVPNSHT